MRSIVQKLTSSSKGLSFRSQGDAARNGREWNNAELAYRQHLEETPTDFDIWVQHAHVLKEQDKLSEAEASYRQAMTLRPNDPDASLHLGHLLKRLGRISEAADMFGISFKAAPTADAYSEFSNLTGAAPLLDSSEVLDAPIELVSRNVTFIEIDDLLGYLEAHKTLSGIQRVQVGVIQHVLLSDRKDADYVFVLNPLDASCLWKLQEQHLSELVHYVTGPNVDHDRLKRIVSQARSGATMVMPEAGQCYLVLGAFWGYGGVAGRYFHLKKAGVVIGAYIYDLIPITHPEYCDAGLSHEFALSFGDGMAVFDFVLTISDYTAREVRRYRERYGLSPMLIEAVPLAHSQMAGPVQKRLVWGPHIAHLKDRQFVLMVSTIEARKNHAYLVAAWKQFLDEGLDPPDLVFVGRFGWHVTSLMEMLDTTRYFDGRIQILHDLSDAELQTLYNTCLYTAFPSFVEGWGLPVGEGLAHGKPCVASSTSSIPEVGGNLVDYLDPHNLRDGLEVLRKMTFDAAYRQQRESDIASNFSPRTWRDVGFDLLDAVALLRPRITINRQPEAFFPAGSPFRIGDLALGSVLPKDYAISPKRLMLTDFWYGVEKEGCWMRGNKGMLKFRSDLPTGTEIAIYLQMFGAPWVQHTNHVVVSLANTTSRPITRRDNIKKTISFGKFLMRCSGLVGENGAVTLNIETDGPIPAEHPNPGARHFIVGMGAIGYAARQDLPARADMLEHFVFNLLG